MLPSNLAWCKMVDDSNQTNEEDGDPLERPPRPLNKYIRRILVDSLEFVSDSYDPMADRSEVQLISRSVFSWLVLLIAIVIMLFSLMADLLNTGEVLNWFQRSGALLVIASLVVEVRSAIISESRSNVEKFLSRINSELRPSNMGFNYGTIHFRRWQRKFRICAWLSAVIGTGIWAYGDLAMCLLKT